MDDILNLENNPSIKELGSQFKLTEVEFWVDCSSGLPFDDEINQYVIDDDACVSNLGWHLTNISFVGTSDGAETPEENNGSDSITSWLEFWLEFCKKDNDYILGEQDLTWKPPLDMDNLAFVYLSKDASNTIHGQTESKEETSSIVVCDGLSGGVNPMQIHNEHLARLELTADSNIEVEDVLMQDYFKDISKYWFQRYLLFSKYDAGIKMDKEGWFSATPECIAEHHASRCGKGVVVDCFTGVGGNAIRFAPKSTHVIAIDIDPNKIEYAHYNANIYGVKDSIDFVTGDSFILAKNLKADTVFLHPPWGGPRQSLFNVAKEIAPRVVMFLPRNVDFGQLAEVSLSASPPWTLEVEKNFINGNLKAITAYFTDPLLQD
ncbi:WW domain-containing protein [Tanacetum coccineum]